ncbi:MAG: ABC-type metal ion transporter, periplasmic subunit [Firmicutes bacterium]|nr:ABC-type metal ion transporter, periplasmic subunit [Bacillota bacterium]
MKSKCKPWLVLVSVLSLVFLLAGCSTKANTANSNEAGQKLKVVASIYPVYEFAKEVGGDKVDISMLVPQGAEPHEWEPTAAEIIKIKGAKLFLYHGAGMENLAKILNQATLGDTKAVAVSQNIPVLTDAPDGAEAIGTTDDHDHHGHLDAHMWLDPLNAQQEVLTIAQALGSVDPANSEYYKANAERYNRQLAELDQEYQQALAQVPRRDIITSHAAFGYLTKRYNLTQVSIMGLTPDSEPTPEKMSKVISICRDHQVKYIFFENLVSPKLSETVARETGAQLLVLNPIESLTAEDIGQGRTYLSIMRDNLTNIKKALSE